MGDGTGPGTPQSTTRTPSPQPVLVGQDSPTTEKPTTPAPVVPYSIFPSWTRKTIVILVIIAGLLSPLSSMLYTPALPEIAHDLGVSISKVNLTITTYLIFQGVAPTIWGAIGDSLGRRMLYITTLTIYVGACVGLAITNSYAAVLVLRALQASGSASMSALGAGVIRDVMHAKERGGYMGLYSAGAGLGTAFGPILGGILAQYTGWHGIFYFLIGLSVTLLLIVILLLPETLRAIVGNGSTLPPRYLRVPIPLLTPRPNTTDSDEPLPPKRHLDIIGAIKLFREPDILCCLFFTGICFAVWNMSMVASSTLYESRYGLSQAEIGLTYIANGIGSLCGSLFTGKMLNHDYKAQLEKEKEAGIIPDKPDGVVKIELARTKHLMVPAPAYFVAVIGFGWTIQTRTHIAAPIVLSFFLGGLDTCILAAFSTLIVDLFEEQSSTASASINLARCALAAVGASVIEPIIKAVDVGWTFTILGGLCIISSPAVFAELHFGQRWRDARRARQRRKLNTDESRSVSSSVEKRAESDNQSSKV